MRGAVISIVLAALCGGSLVCASPGPVPLPEQSAIAQPRDRAFAGNVELHVDATDVERRIVSVHEHLTGVGGEMVVLYPEWLPGNHAPQGSIDKLAGIKMSVDGKAVSWIRDSVNVFAFHVHVGQAKSLDIEFQYLTPTSAKVGKAQLSHNLLILEWPSLFFYPAGYFVRQIPVEVQVSLPPDWRFATALEVAASLGAWTRFKRTSIEVLADSPIYAGRYYKSVDLDPGGVAPVNLNFFADRDELLDLKPEQLAAHRMLVQQAYKLFNSHHYAHYDFLYSLSEQVEQNGLEHQQSSEDGADPQMLVEWDKNAWERDLLPHEFTHSWNGKFRRPADLWTPNFNLPMRNSLLWVYEGQTQYWGWVLAARSGLWSKDTVLGQLALTAGNYDIQSGRRWRNLLDTTADPIINPRRPMSWRDWQRFEEYYSEGAMIWLDIDTLIREHSQGRRSLDDFAKAFFGIQNGSTTTVTYTFDDLIKTLNSIDPYDWSQFLTSKLESSGSAPFAQGLSRGGYRLTYLDTPSEYQKNRDAARNRVSLAWSIGVEIDPKDASLATVMWGGPAYEAKLTEGTQILAVNGTAYSADVLKDAIRAAHAHPTPIELIVKNGDQYHTVSINYSGGLRYPRLERDADHPGLLDDILKPRP